MSPPEVQLKPRHRPLRLVRHWPELLLRFSLGSPAAIAQGEGWGVGEGPFGDRRVPSRGPLAPLTPCPPR